MADTSGYQAICFYDPATGTPVQIDGSALERVDFNQDDMESDKTTARGNKPFVGHVSELEVETWDWTGLSQLRDWAESDTPISFVAAGHQRNIQWYETDRISLSLSPKSQTGQANTYVVSMRREGGGAHDIHNNINLLHYLDWRGSDSDADGVPDGYTNTGFTSTAFTDADGDSVAEQFEGFGPTDGSGVSLQVADLVFPISGVTLTESILVNQLHADGNTAQALVAKNYAGSNLATATDTITATGRASQSVELPTNTYKLVANVISVNGATAQTSKVKAADPALRIDGSDTFVQH